MTIPILSDALGWVIKMLYNLFGQNYLLTLFLFAVLVKLLLLPLGIHQQKGSIKQAKMRPKEMAIRKKYAGRNDKVTQQKLNEEIMQLYQDEHFNPMSGCLPLLIQMPILFALYGVIIRPLTYISSLGSTVIDNLKTAYTTVTEVATNAYSEISIVQQIVENKDGIAAKVGEEFTKLSADSTVAWDSIFEKLTSMHQSFSVMGVDLTVTPSFKLNLYILIPILTFVFAFLSTKIIRKFTYQPQQSVDPSQARSLAMMDWMMPLMSVWISFSVSSAIAVYWIFQNVLSAVQQILLFKLFPIPQVTEEQIREAELQMKGKAAKAKPVKATYEVDDYDKTPSYEKQSSTSKKNKKNDANRLGIRKVGISPKIKAEIKKTGKSLKARRKI